MGRWWRFVLVGVLVIVVAGCAPPARPGPAAPPAPISSVPAMPSPAQAAADAGDAAVGREDAVVGIAVLDRSTGTLATNAEGATPFNSASLSKVLTAVDVLAGGATAADLDLIRAALGPSDDQAMNTLWSRSDGEKGIERTVDALGLQDTTAPDDGSQWGEVQLSPRDMAGVLRYVADDLAPDARDLVLSALGDAPPVAADGFDQAFGLLDPERRDGTQAKQGWLCCLGDRVDLHSAGLTGPDGRFVVSIFSRQPYGYPAARQELDGVAAAIRDELGA